MTPEGAVLAAILEYLAIRQVFAWRVNTGAVKLADKTGKTRFVRFGFPGCSDIIGVIGSEIPAWEGRPLAIEVKSPTGKATEEQLIFLAEIAKRGGLAFIARSVEDVERELTKPRRRI
ncbi:MAG: VRR-NUC domain-containing protein [Vicinamibacterales bacterium]|jgi:hypothetical protein